MDHDPHTDQLAQNLAANLRYLRERSGLTQARLGALAEVPRSTLANLETGSGNPTLQVIARLSGALRVTLEELLSTPHGLGTQHPAGSLPVEHKGSRVTIHTLLPDPVPGLEFQRQVLRPGGRFPGVPHRPGTREYLYVERGHVVLRVAGERFDVGAGDVVSFRGDQPHSYANDGDVEAVAISVVAIS